MAFSLQALAKIHSNLPYIRPVRGLSRTVYVINVISGNPPVCFGPPLSHPALQQPEISEHLPNILVNFLVACGRMRIRRFLNAAPQCIALISKPPANRTPQAAMSVSSHCGPRVECLEPAFFRCPSYVAYHTGVLQASRKSRVLRATALFSTVASPGHCGLYKPAATVDASSDIPAAIGGPPAMAPSAWTKNKNATASPLGTSVYVDIKRDQQLFLRVCLCNSLSSNAGS